MLNRRRFLATGTLAVAAGALKASAPQPLADWNAVRAEFDLDPVFVHLSLFYLASHPRPVRAAIDEWRRRLDANPLLTVEHATGARDVANALARYIGGEADDIALTQNTTTGLAIIYHGLPLQRGDEVLTTEHDHSAHHESIRLATARSGATFRTIALFDSFDAIDEDDIVERIRAAIRPQTRVVGVTWVHSASGVKLPIRRIADVLASINAKRERRVLLVVDGVHGFGVESPRIAAMGCDAFASGTHKWLMAPRGTGFVWAKGDVWDSMRPLIPSFTPGTRASRFSPGGFQAFEHYWAVPAALDFHARIGPARVTERIHALSELAKNELAKMPHVTLYTPRSRALSAGIVCFDVRGMTQRETVDALQSRFRILASTTPYRVSYARIAFGIQNDEDDVERTLRAIRALA